MIKWYRFVTWIWFRTRLFYAWTIAYRFFNEKKWLRQTLPVVTAIEDIEDLMADIKWESDKKRWGDSISTPQATYGRYEIGLGSDCEDSSFLAATLLESLRKKDPTIGIKEVGLLIVLWKGGGHAVCTFKLDGNVYVHNPEIGAMRAYQYAHIGNWNLGKAKKGFASIQAIILDILNSANKKQDECCGWSLLDTKLNHVKYSTCAKL